jgi:phosphonate transport system ATP-binding protein
MRLRLADTEGRYPAGKRESPPAIRDLSLSIEAGEQVAVIGPSGAGKTTLLQLIGAALKPSAGMVWLNDCDVWSLPTRELQRLRGQLVIAPQTPPLPPRQRVITALTAGALPSMSLVQSLANLVYPQRIREAREALTAFDIEDKLWDRVDRLSGGERQRVGLARVLMAPASLWLIDEPLSALDPTRERGVTLVTTLHQVDVATSRFPRVIGMRDGELVFDLPASQVSRERLAELYAQHEHELAGVQAPVLDLPGEPLPPKIVHCR